MKCQCGFECGEKKDLIYEFTTDRGRRVVVCPNCQTRYVLKREVNLDEIHVKRAA
jgi:hypothetical protein